MDIESPINSARGSFAFCRWGSSAFAELINSSAPSSAPDSTLPARRRVRLFVPVALLAGAALIVLCGPWVVERWHYAAARGRQRAAAEQLPAAGISQGSPGSSVLPQLSAAFGQVAQRVSPSVVHIDASGGRRAAAAGSAPPAQGAGVILDSEGFVLTNRHVLHEQTEVQVFLADGRQLPGRLIGADKLTDLAVLKIEANDLTAAQWGDSAAVSVGSLVLAIGSPYGLQRTVSIGILSATDRPGFDGQAGQLYLQTDAAIYPGSSGGPLLDDQGQVIGINTAVVGSVDRGIGFAVPSEAARDVYRQLKETGFVARGWLGMSLGPLSDEDRELPGAPRSGGARVVEVLREPPSPALAAGLRSGDVIVEWDGQRVVSPSWLSERIAQSPPLRRITAVVLNASGRRELRVTIGPANDDARHSPGTGEDAGRRRSNPRGE